MNVILSCYKDKTNIPIEVKPESTAEEIKIKLKQLLEEKAEYKYTYYEINLLYSSQILDDKKNLSSYNIQNNNRIFYYYKRKKAKGINATNKTNNSIIKQIDSIDSINIDDKMNQKEGENNNEINESLSIYSSIIKILTYYEPSYMKIILDYLSGNNTKLFDQIKHDRDNFASLLKMAITNDDIQFYKENYDKVLVLKKAIKEHNNNNNNNNNNISNNNNNISNNNKEIIILNEEDDKFIRSWILKSNQLKKGLDKETIILEYIKNKFNKEKTSLSLKEILYNE